MRWSPREAETVAQANGVTMLGLGLRPGPLAPSGLYCDPELLCAWETCAGKLIRRVATLPQEAGINVSVVGYAVRA